MNLSKARICIPDHYPPVAQRAAALLCAEFGARVGRPPRICTTRPDSEIPCIELRLAGQKPANGFRNSITSVSKPDAYNIRCEDSSASLPGVVITGGDARGLLYGVGRFLRVTRMAAGSAEIDPRIDFSSSPRMALRGHQLGHRDLNNTYDAWSLAQFEQYIGELAMFGANAIELLPPRTDGVANRQHFKGDPLEMMIALSEMIHAFGMEVWVWYPNLLSDIGDHEGQKNEIREREELFGRVPHIDALFIPGGDPGNLKPLDALAMAELSAASLRRQHPKAKVWFSPQFAQPKASFMDEFHRALDREPAWLDGLVFGPWVKGDIERLRERTPERFPIRFYPDISHAFECQFPLPDWDPAFAITQGREFINPRPSALKLIHSRHAPYCIGSITYSEGINDDINKFVWSGLDWDPDEDPRIILEDYARLFLGAAAEERFADAVIGLEKSWKGPLADNAGIEPTLGLWQELARRCSATAPTPYRLKLGLFRAHYDSYLKRREARERAAEADALQILKESVCRGSLEAMDSAMRVLDAAAVPDPMDQDRSACLRIADELFEEIGYQTSVQRHGAFSWLRGAALDGLDLPLNDAPWYRMVLGEIRKLASEEDRLREISRRITERNAVVPGGLYDDLGSPGMKAIAIPALAWEDDPGFLRHPLRYFSLGALERLSLGKREVSECPPRRSELVHLRSLFNSPLILFYRGLDTRARYRLRVVYNDSYKCGKFRLMANERYIVHDFIGYNDPSRDFNSPSPPGRDAGILEFSGILPAEETSSGSLRLKWECDDGDMGISVAELWLEPIA